jgi:hypothetical protein
MTRAPRVALFLLLALMQAIAPWVHAHTGLETGGFLHLPGLEFLAPGGQGPAATEAAPDAMDLIVGIQAGAWNGDGAVKACPGDFGPALPPAARPSPAQPAAALPPRPPAPPPGCLAAFRVGYPRAPPSIPSRN